MKNLLKKLRTITEDKGTLERGRGKNEIAKYAYELYCDLMNSNPALERQQSDARERFIRGIKEKGNVTTSLESFNESVQGYFNLMGGQAPLNVKEHNAVEKLVKAAESDSNIELSTLGDIPRYSGRRFSHISHMCSQIRLNMGKRKYLALNLGLIHDYIKPPKWELRDADLILPSCKEKGLKGWLYYLENIELSKKIPEETARQKLCEFFQEAKKTNARTVGDLAKEGWFYETDGTIGAG